MRPTIHDGDVLTVDRVEPAAIVPGDIVLYYHRDRPIAHRVTEVRSSTDAGIVVLARGDGKASCDAPIRARQILGRIVSIERLPASALVGRGASLSGLVRDAVTRLQQVIQPPALFARTVAVLACLALGAVTVEAQVTSGTYLCTGVDNTAISGLGFQPSVLMIKGSHNPIVGGWNIVMSESGTPTYASGTWRPGLTAATGDLDGDGRTDVFLYDAATGAWVGGVARVSDRFAYRSGQWSPGWSFPVRR